MDREDARARLKHRLVAQRKAALKNGKDNPTSSAGLKASPKAFSSLSVKDRLSKSQVALAKTPQSSAKKETSKDFIPTTIALPHHKSAGTKREVTPAKGIVSKKKDQNVDHSMKTPRTGTVGLLSAYQAPEFHSAAAGGDVIRSPEREAELYREASLAVSLSTPDEDESESVLQLAQEVQRAAEDELSFHGSLDTREQMNAEYS
jgi:hypothetical protein